FRRALELEPDNEEALIGLPDAYIRAEELGAAEAAARKAVERLPQSPEAVLTLGLVLGVRGASQEAERVLRRAMELAPDDARPPFRLAELLVTEGRNLQEAVELADRSAEIDAAEGMPAALAAVALRKLGRDADALERLHTAALNYPRNTRLWLMMAAIYRDQGNERAAAEATSYALRFAPRRPTGQEADDAGPTPSE
ncbi:MAG: tetratricopeptide repeat protein, partial [Armatimonadota bacterium]